MTKLSVIEGIAENYEQKLKNAGISNVEALLSFCKSKKNRADLAKGTKISEKLILKWANHADLMRIKGIGGEYAELLEASGVDTVAELSTRKPANLYAKMTEVNEQKKLVRKRPTENQLSDWVKQAKKLPKALTY